ncbi:MAG: hypothetical protein AAF614_37925 [Chloroflexota bacterium]
MDKNEVFDLDAHNQKMDAPGKWVFLVPVYGVELTSSVNNEFQINRVLLVRKEKISRIRKRLGIPTRISKLDDIRKKFFQSANTFAIIRHTGTREQVKIKCRQIVRDELSILSVSQLGYNKRRRGSCPSLKGILHPDTHTGGLFPEVLDGLLIDSLDQRYEQSGKLVGKYRPLVLDADWKKFQKLAFFLQLLKVLTKSKSVDDSWRKNLERASILIGQSQCSQDIVQSFLWNMIALEVLLTEQIDKVKADLPDRIEAFLGWTGYWKTQNYKGKILELYSKRNQFVHRGKRSHILVEDLLFTDDLLLNLMINLMKHINIFQSKQDIVNFSDKIQAEHVLGIESRVRPQNLWFFSRKYDEQDLAQI